MSLSWKENFAVRSNLQQWSPKWFIDLDSERGLELIIVLCMNEKTDTKQPWEWLVTIVKSGYSSQGRYATAIHYSGVSSFCIAVSWPTWLRYHLTANSWSKTNTIEPSNSARIPRELFSEEKTNRGRSFYGERHSLRMNLLDTFERFEWSFRYLLYLRYFLPILFRPRF